MHNFSSQLRFPATCCQHAVSQQILIRHIHVNITNSYQLVQPFGNIEQYCIPRIVLNYKPCRRTRWSLDPGVQTGSWNEDDHYDLTWQMMTPQFNFQPVEWYWWRSPGLYSKLLLNPCPWSTSSTPVNPRMFLFKRFCYLTTDRCEIKTKWWTSMTSLQKMLTSWMKWETDF